MPTTRAHHVEFNNYEKPNAFGSQKRQKPWATRCHRHIGIPTTNQPTTISTANDLQTAIGVPSFLRRGLQVASYGFLP